MIEFSCPRCGKQLRVQDELAGKQGKCPQCGTILAVPGSGVAAAVAVAATPPPVPRTRSNHPAAIPAINPETLGGYTRSTLQPDETPLHKTSFHWLIFVRFALLGLLSLVLALLVGAGVQANSGSSAGWLALLLPAWIVLCAVILYATSEFVITDRRVLIKFGFIRRKTMEIFISKIESVGVDQGIVERLFDCGTITVRGTGGSANPFRSIAHPIAFRNCIQRIQSQTDPATNRPD